MRISVRLLIAVACCCPLVAWADIYAFVDAEGVTHFSNVPTDDRFVMVLEEKSQDTTSGSAVRVAGPVLQRSTQYEPIIASAAASTGVDADLLRAVIVVESGFDATAVSVAGAQGLMQLMPQTARRFGVSDPLDPEQNIHAGARYLGELISMYDADFELALAAYNAGEDAVERYGKSIPPFAETIAYVPKVLSVYSTLANL